LPAVLSLYGEPDIDDGRVLSIDTARAIWAKIKQYPDYTVYVATAGEDVVGTFTLLVMDNLAHMGARSGIIEDVVVKPGWRRRGVGSRMMRFALDVCKTKGCYKAALSSNQQRESAHTFYESLGFARHGYSFLIDL